MQICAFPFESVAGGSAHITLGQGWGTTIGGVGEGVGYEARPSSTASWDFASIAVCQSRRCGRHKCTCCWPADVGGGGISHEMCGQASCGGVGSGGRIWNDRWNWLWDISSLKFSNQLIESYNQ